MSDEQGRKPKRPKRRQSRFTPEEERSLETWFQSITPKFSEEHNQQFFQRIREKAGLKRTKPEKLKRFRPWTEEDEQLDRLASEGSIDAEIELTNRDLEAIGTGRLSEEKEKDLRNLLQESYSGILPQNEPLYEPSGEPTANKETNGKQWTQEIENEYQKSSKKWQR